MGTNNKKFDLNDLIGQKIRNLTVVRFSHQEQVQQLDRLRNKFLYECLCDCGTKTLVSRFHLKQKNTASATWSCGCYQKSQSLKGHDKQRNKPRASMQKPNGASVLHTQFLAYKAGAVKRNLNFELTEEQFAELTKQNCVYCGSEPREVKKRPKDFVFRMMNGIDRVDPSIGYVLTNCLPCCKICNYMKLDMSQADFLIHINKIVTFINGR